MVDSLGRKIRAELIPEDEASLPTELGPKLTEVTTDSIEAFRSYSQGWWLARQGREHEAIALMEQALELDPDFADPLGSLAVSYSNLFVFPEKVRHYVSLAFEQRERLRPAQRAYVEGFYYSQSDETLALSLEAYARHAELDPLGAGDNRPVLFMQLERFEEAATIFEQRLARPRPHHYAYANLAVCQTGLGRLDEAELVLQRLLELESESHLAHRQLGVLYTAWHRWDDAIEMLERAESIAPGDWLTTAARWQAHVMKGEQDVAKAIESRALASTDPASQVFAQFARLRRLTNRGRFGEAIQHISAWREALSGTILASSGDVFLAVLELYRGNNSQAAAYAHRELHEDLRTGTEIYERLYVGALAEMRSGNHEAALVFADELRRRAEELPSQREVRRHHLLLGELALEQGEHEEAIRQLEMARSLLSPGRGLGGRANT